MVIVVGSGEVVDWWVDVFGRVRVSDCVVRLE